MCRVGVLSVGERCMYRVGVLRVGRGSCVELGF